MTCDTSRAWGYHNLGLVLLGYHYRAGGDPYIASSAPDVNH